MSDNQEKPKILLVDDQPENIEVMANILGDTYQVLVALEGAKALDIAGNEDSPDLILLDVVMPDMDGYEVCRRLQDNQKTKDIPIIFVTAMNDAEDEAKGFDLGAVDFITKPLSPSIVRARIRTQLALKEARNRIEGFSDQLSRYLSPQIKQSIFEGKQDASIGASRKKLTIFFSDIVGFTSQTESMEPEDLTSLLNSYLDKMSVIALKHGGTVDKFIGDAVLIFFGDPETRGVKQDALSCVEMALEMQNAIEDLNQEWKEKGVVNGFSVRSGITTGYCTVGNFGSETRMDYTIIGNQVNLAARLESNAAPGSVLIAQETYALINDQIECVEKEAINAKGFEHPVPAFQALGPKTIIKEDQIIEDKRNGFSILLDPKEIDENDREKILEHLRAAISNLR